MNLTFMASSARISSLAVLLAMASVFAFTNDAHGQNGYAPQLAYGQAAMPSAYRQQGAPPPAGAGLPPGQGYTMPQQGYSQPVFPQQQAGYPGAASANNAAYGQLPTRAPTAPKPKTKAPSLLPQANAPYSGGQYPVGAYPGEPVPYPQAPAAPKPAPAAAPKQGHSDERLYTDINVLKNNDQLQDRRISNLEQQVIAGRSISTGSSHTSPSTNYVRHQVRPGESLWGIADRYHASADDIRSANRMNNNFVNAGDVLLVPTRQASKATSTNNASNRPAVAKGGTHTVQRGESLSSIAAGYRVSLSSLQSANAIKNANLISVGQRLVIPGRNAPADTPVAAQSSKKKSTTPIRYVAAPPKSTPAVVKAPAPEAPPAAGSGLGKPITPKGPRGVTSYRIEPGDTVEGVARAYSTTPADLTRINHLAGNKLPAAGEEIVVPLPGAVSL